MKKIVVLLILFVSLTVGAQEGKPRMSPEEFQAKQKEFITKRACLTEAEVKAFFPLYYELQGKKRELNDNAWKKARKSKDNKPTEEECNRLIDELADVKIQCDQLEKDYLAKYKKILPASKIFKVQMAETHFQRELLKEMQRPHSKQDADKANQREQKEQQNEGRRQNKK